MSAPSLIRETRRYVIDSELDEVANPPGVVGELRQGVDVVDVVEGRQECAALDANLVGSWPGRENETRPVVRDIYVAEKPRKGFQLGRRVAVREERVLLPRDGIVEKDARSSVIRRTAEIV